jgi:hypothetical protein
MGSGTGYYCYYSRCHPFDREPKAISPCSASRKYHQPGHSLRAGLGNWAQTSLPHVSQGNPDRNEFRRRNFTRINSILHKKNNISRSKETWTKGSLADQIPGLCGTNLAITARSGALAHSIRLLAASGGKK